MNHFFTELKRRNVYKIAVAYAVVGWLLIQVATQVFPFFEIPNWAVRLVVLSLVLGFPVALLLAWAFEVTPEGIKRTATDTKATRSRRGTAWIYVVLIAAGLSMALFFLGRYSASGRRGGSAPSGTSKDKSIAVLPFQNLSSDAQNAFFAQGIQDEIITTLSKISGLRVISRTSTARYKSAPENLPQIARELGATNVLEGSVQKAGDRVHINVQLIQAENDGHLWAQSYDRQLTDIFGVEGEVAKSIADSLSATLSPQEKARVESKPTTNADAYILYLRGREYQSRPDTLLQDFQNAAQSYEQALALDPHFALAHARLSATYSVIYHWFEPTEARKQRAVGEAQEALRLDPNLGEAHLALGLYYYYEEQNLDRALQEMDLAARVLPNDADVGLFIAAIKRRQGHWRESIAAYKKAAETDPRNSVVLYDTAQTFVFLRDWPATIDVLNRLLAITPDSLQGRLQRGYVEFYQIGSTEPIKTALKNIPANTDPDGAISFARWDVALIDRDPDAAQQALDSCRADPPTSSTGVPLTKSYLQAYIDLMRGNVARAQANFEAARPALEKIVNSSPQDFVRHAQLGLLYALIGRKADAVREGQRAVELKPAATDAIDGPLAQTFLCLIYTRVGENDQAISLLEGIQQRPGYPDVGFDSTTLSDLRRRWEWDPLRNDPRFQKIIAGPEPKPVY